MKNDATSILSRLGKQAKQNQSHTASDAADKKDPNTPLEDVTTQGGIEGDAQKGRTIDKKSGKDPIDTSKGETPKDSSAELQDASKDHENIYKGKSSVPTANVIGKKLKESLQLDVNLEDMKNLLESDESNDEAFVVEALSIFEATMLDVLNKQVDNMVESAAELMEAAINEEVQALEEEVEERLNIAVMEWAEDNKLVIEESARVNIAESFMSDLTKLMEAYNIQLPEESVDLYETAIEKGEKLLEENEELQKSLKESNEELQLLNKAIYVESFVHEHNLTVTEAERLRNVSSTLEFLNEDDFNKKLNTITEGYIKRSSVNESSNKQTETISEDHMNNVEDTDTMVNVDPAVAMLAKNFIK